MALMSQFRFTIATKDRTDLPETRRPKGTFSEKTAFGKVCELASEGNQKEHLRKAFWDERCSKVS